MKLLFQYTFDYITRNRRSSMAIMVAILMTSTMMSALCGYFYNIYTNDTAFYLRESGDWHGELFDDTMGSQLSVIDSFDSIESTMIKGAWKAAQIEDSRRDYLVWRDANTAYWNSMPEGLIGITEGRMPEKTGEIALSKQYFERHPEITLGDSLTLPLGNRIAADDSVISPPSVSQSEESFVKTGVVTLTVVGKLDVTTSSTVPAYTALGYLDPATILPEDKLTVYFRFHNIHDTYKELPKIAEALGYEKDEYGNMLLRYNTDYLIRKGVLSPEQMGFIPLLMAKQAPLSFAVMGLLVAALFVLIIHNAFALSSSARLSQLGIFASVGATPKQIKRSVLLEAFLLTAIPLPVGLALGQLAISSLIRYSNDLDELYQMMDMTYVIGWQSLLPAVLLTVLTVWWSALIPARKISRMSPIAAIRQGAYEKLKKPRRFSMTRLFLLFGINGELAANALQARKKSYRTATISLTLSFLTLACFLNITTASEANEAVCQWDAKYWANQDIGLSLYNIETQEDFDYISEKINALEGIDTVTWYTTLRAASWLPEEGFSKEFEKKGGFVTVEDKLANSQVPLLRDGNRRVGMTILGLDDAAFSAYCDTLSIDPAPFYDKDRWRTILYHTVKDVGTGTLRNPVTIPFLSAAPGDILTLTEKTTDSYEGDFSFDVEISAIANQMPPIDGDSLGARYSAVPIMPMSQVRMLAADFAQSNIVRVKSVIKVIDPAQITPVRTKIETICESEFGSGDYWIMDEVAFYETEAAGDLTTAIMFGFVVALLAVIGLSNVWSTVRGTLNARRREFAMLRSVGLPPKGLQKMLLLEAILLGLTPILLSLPALLILQCIFLNINEITFLEWLPYAPWLPLLLYISSILLMIVIAYIAGGRNLLRENIIDTMDSV